MKRFQLFLTRLFQPLNPPPVPTPEESQRRAEEATFDFLRTVIAAYIIHLEDECPDVAAEYWAGLGEYEPVYRAKVAELRQFRNSQPTPT